MRALRIVCVLLLAGLPSQDAEARRRSVKQPLPPLTISAIEPRSGAIAGGTAVTIRGSGFVPGNLQVFFDDQAATSLTYVAANELRAITPPHANGYVAVRTVNEGRSASGGEFFYTPPALDSIANGSITTVAGIGLYAAEGAAATAAPFDVAGGDIAVDTDGSVLVIEGDRYVIRKIAPDGTCTRFAGRGVPLTPSEAAANDIGDGLPATSAPAGGRGITIAPDGNAYLATLFFHRIRRIDRQTGIISTVVGSGPITYQGAFAGDGGPASAARLDQPNQVSFDGKGNMYILDAFNYRIRRVAPDGIINTVAGNGSRGFSGDGGAAVLASFDIGPNGDVGALKADGEGNLFLADVENRRIRRIDGRSGVISTIAGGGTRQDDGTRAIDQQISVAGIAIAPDGTAYFSDASRIRRIARDGIVTTVFGELTAGFSEDGTRTGRLSAVGRMEVDATRNRLLFLESSTSRVRAIDLATGTLSTIAGIGPAAFGENGPGIAAELDIIGADSTPIALTAGDELLIGGYRRLRRLEGGGELRTIAGGGLNSNTRPPTPRPALGTPLDPRGIAAAANGDIYVTGPYEVGRITPDGTYRRIAGGAYGYSGDNGPASAATLDNPAGIVIDTAGNLFIADTWNHCIRRIDAQTGVITTFAGKSPPHPPNVLIQPPSAGDGGRAIDAQIAFPIFLALDAAGNVYVTDTSSVRMIDGNGIIGTVLDRSRCNAGALAADPSGRVFVRCFNGQILRIDGKNTTTLIGGTSGRFGMSGDGQPAAQAEARDINGMVIDHAGNIYLLDAGNRRIRAIRGIAK